MNTSGIVPVDVKVVALPDPPEEKSKGGILMPDTVKEQNKFAATKATIVAVGANAFAEWGRGNGPATGARVLIAQYAGANVKGADGKDYRVLNDEDVIAVLECEA